MHHEEHEENNPHINTSCSLCFSWLFFNLSQKTNSFTVSFARYFYYKTNQQDLT